jgi:hypothetical protein
MSGKDRSPDTGPTVLWQANRPGHGVSVGLSGECGKHRNLSRDRGEWAGVNVGYARGSISSRGLTAQREQFAAIAERIRPCPTPDVMPSYRLAVAWRPTSGG